MPLSCQIHTFDVALEMILCSLCFRLNCTCNCAVGHCCLALPLPLHAFNLVMRSPASLHTLVYMGHDFLQNRESLRRAIGVRNRGLLKVLGICVSVLMSWLAWTLADIRTLKSSLISGMAGEAE